MTSRKDAAFFDAFASHAKKSLAAAGLLVQLMGRLRSGNAAEAYHRPSGTVEASGPPELESLARAIKQAETDGDTITHETMKRLHETWLTPLDRDDIHRLISRMDDILDEIEAAADRIVLFDLHVAVPEARELSEVLVRSCEALVDAIGLLRDMSNAKKILALCVEVNRLENVADQLHRAAMRDLFLPGNDPLTVMKWRDVFENLEAAADRCEDVADVLEGVVLEYA